MGQRAVRARGRSETMASQWYYRTTDGNQVGPIDENALRALIERGELQPGQLVWRQGFAGWLPLEQVPELSRPIAPTPLASAAPAPPAPVEQDAGVPQGGSPATLPPGLLGWMTFVGVMTLISGALSILSCVGLPSGVLLVVAAVSLFGARSALEQPGTLDAHAAPFLNKLKTFFVMQGLVYIIGLLIAVVVFMVYFGVIMAAIAGGDF